MKKLFIIICFLNSAYAQNVDLDADKIFKIDDTTFVLESAFLPGAGHLYNDHYRSAFLSFFSCITFFSNAIGSSGYDFHPTNDQFNINDYEQKFRYLQKRSESNTFMMLFIFSYFDSIIDSYFASNKRLPDSAIFKIGVDSFFSGLKTSALVNDGQTISNDQTSKKSVGLMLGATYGYLIDKELFLSLGPQLVFSYDMSYDFLKYKYFSFNFSNHFDLQQQLYEFLDDGKTNSYDEYRYYNDFFTLGMKVFPIKKLIIESGFSFFTVAATWESFSGQDSVSPDFSQAHSAKNGFFNGEYYYVKASYEYRKNIFFGLRAKHYYVKESFTNIEEEAPNYFNLLRINVFANYLF